MTSEKRTFQPLTLAVLIMALVAACTGGSRTSDRANAAWADRLAQQAGYVQQEQQRAEGARTAWTQRLEAQVHAHQQEQARAQRANQAWSDRLSELAGRYGGN
jgi:hypothetical protein